MISRRQSKKELSYDVEIEKEKWLSDQTPAIESLKLHDSSVDSVILNSNYLFSGSHDKTIKKTDVNKKKVVNVYTGHESGIWCMDLNKE